MRGTISNSQNKLDNALKKNIKVKIQKNEDKLEIV